MSMSSKKVTDTAPSNTTKRKIPTMLIAARDLNFYIVVLRPKMNGIGFAPTSSKIFPTMRMNM